MMKQHTSLLLILAGGLIVPGLEAVQKKAKKAPSSFTAAKVLGALGLAGAGTAGAYYAYDKDDATKKFEEGKKYLTGVRDSVVDYVKKADNRTIGLGILGTAAASYIAYKLFIQEKEQDDEVDGLAIETPDADAIMKNLGSSRSSTSSQRKPASKLAENYGNWPKEAGNLFWQVFASVKDEQKRHAVVKPYMDIAAQDPHQLIRDKKLIERLNDDQKLKLLQIMVDYTMDRIIKAAQALNGHLTDDQEGVQFMLKEALELALVQNQVFALRDLLQTLVTEAFISVTHAKFVKGELAIIKKCVEIQARFSKAHDLDALLAKRLQPETQAKPKMHKASPARR